MKIKYTPNMSLEEVERYAANHLLECDDVCGLVNCLFNDLQDRLDTEFEKGRDEGYKDAIIETENFLWPMKP